MKRGVSFEIDQTENNDFHSVLDYIHVADYWWYNVESQQEVWSDSFDKKEFLQQSFYNGDLLSKQFPKDCSVIFLKLQAYFTKENIKNIDTYSDFLCSSCQMIFLLYDCEFIEIYIKDQNLIRSVYSNAKKFFKNVSYITDANDERNCMNIV